MFDCCLLACCLCVVCALPCCSCYYLFCIAITVATPYIINALIISFTSLSKTILLSVLLSLLSYLSTRGSTLNNSFLLSIYPEDRRLICAFKREGGTWSLNTRLYHISYSDLSFLSSFLVPPSKFSRLSGTEGVKILCRRLWFGTGYCTCESRLVLRSTEVKP